MKMFDPRSNPASIALVAQGRALRATRMRIFVCQLFVALLFLLGHAATTLADSYPATLRYEVGAGNCPILPGTMFPTAAAAAESCAQSYDAVSGSTVCDWYFPGTMSHEWPEPLTAEALRVYTGPCDLGLTNYVSDIYRSLSCAWGGTLSGTQCTNAPPCGEGISRDADGQCPRKACPQQCPPTQEGNPIQVALGNKVQIETDYVSAGAFPLTFARIYNSVALPSSSTWSHQWRHTFDRRIQPRVGQTPESVDVFGDDGRSVHFTASGSNWVVDGDVTDQLVKLFDGAGVAIGWQYTVAADQRIERYDVAGRLLSITYRSGLVQQFTYALSIFAWYPSTAPACLGSVSLGQLSCVTDSLGRQLNLGYDGAGRLWRLTDFAGRQTVYSYDANWDLAYVTYPDGKVKQYHYNESANTSGANLPYALTGITDESNVRYATFKYDSQGRAISTEHASGAEKVSMSYSSGSTTFTDALGTARTYAFQTILGTARTVSLSQPCVGCSFPFASATYDTNGNPSSRTDFNGDKTCYAYDLARNLELHRLEGVASGVSCPANLASSTPTVGTRQRKISTQWHSTFRLPTQVDEPGKRTTFTHDANGNVLTRTVLDTTTSESRTWTYTYNGLGQVLTANGPRTDATDVTTYAYYGTAATCTATVAGAAATGCRGEVQTVTNALGHVTTFNEYDADGHALKITDPNGVVTTLAYDARLRLTSRSVGR